jgi:hypothetical protein
MSQLKKVKLEMTQYLILAQDRTDSEAQSRRLNARPFHLETIKSLKADGHFVIGGATLNERKEMNGSMMVVEFENEKLLHDWLDNDPYVIQSVWESVEVKPFKVANI